MNLSSIDALRAVWPAVSALLDEALALPVPQRAGWLDALAGPRAQHRETLRSLLATQARIETGDYLDDLPVLPAAPASPAAHAAAPGLRVGPFRLLSQIGRGGMSSVWRAERVDGVLGRPVAVKLPAVAWGEAFAGRLLREREILASLTHEHIARLYDAGVDGFGRPFLAMEYVDGQPIDVHCRVHRLSLRARVALLLQVMAAVAHAHARLVVHRDLKPSNIMVDAQGKVCLLDFGIAKLLSGELTQDSALTRLGGHALTPDYASPEQLRGEPLGTATDVYSLGVVAYLLLSGRLPYRLPQAGAAGLADAIAAVQVPPASEAVAIDADDAQPGGKVWRRQLAGDLDAILHRALKQRADERYPSVDALAEDLRRWRDGEPVQARPDSLAYRAGKFVSRHRVQAGAGALALLALVGGSALALWQAQEARAQARRAMTEAAVARTVQDFIESVFLANTGNQPDPEAARGTTARELLDRGAARIEQALAAAPEAQLRLIERMQEMYTHMALNDRAAALQRQGLALATRLHGADSPQAIGQSTALAKTLIEMNRRDEARSLLLEAEAALRGGARADAGLLLTIDQTLAFLHVNEDPVQALRWARQAAALAQGRPVSQETINALQMVGETAFKLGELQEAEAALRAAQAQIERHPEAGEGGLPLVLATLGTTLGRQGRPEAAQATLLQAQALAQRLGDPYSLHLVRQKLGAFQLDHGLLQQALALAADEFAWAQGAGPDFGALPLLLGIQYARALTAAGQAAKALEVVDRQAAAAASLPSDLQAGRLVVRAGAWLALGRPAAAQADAERAVQLAGEHGWVVGEARQARRRAWAANGQAARALQDFQADRFVAAVQGPLPALRRQAAEAALRAAAGDAAGAGQQAAAALATLAPMAERSYARLDEAELCELLGRALLQQGRAAEALAPLARAEALWRELQADRADGRLAAARRWLAQARRAAGPVAAR